MSPPGITVYHGAMEQLLPSLLLLAAGLVLRRLPVFPAETDRSLNLYVIYVALPALILIQIPSLHFSRAALATVIIPWCALILSALLVLILARILRWSREVTGALLLMVPLGNTSFLGIPMVEQFFGRHLVGYALLYDQFGSFLALSTYGTLILALYGQGDKPTLARVLIKIFTFPPLIALVAALALPPASLLTPIRPALSLAADSLVPVVLVAIGFQMRLLLPARELAPFVLGLGIKMLGIPALLIAVSRMLGFSGDPLRVALFEAGMPPMVTAGALAAIAGLKPGLTSAMVGFGILVSFFTLPLLFPWLP